MEVIIRIDGNDTIIPITNQRLLASINENFHNIIKLLELGYHVSTIIPSVSSCACCDKID